MIQGEDNDADPAEELSASDAAWRLRLYVNGRTSLRTVITLQNLTELCEKYLGGRYELEVVDLVEDFARAREDQVMAIPTLVRCSPQPVRKIIGDLSNTGQVITALGLPGANPYEL
jgi:circadian clock protein KaiB